MTPEQIRNIAVPLWDKIVDAASVGKTVEVMRLHGLMNKDKPFDVNGLLHFTATAAVK